MISRLHSIISASAITILSACGGGSSDDTDTMMTTPTFTAPTGSLFGGATGSSIGGSTGGATTTAFPTMPAAGSGPYTTSEVAAYDSLGELDLSGASLGAPSLANATYNGLVGLEEFDSSDPTTETLYIGRATLNANFNQSTISGTTANFFKADGTVDTTNIINQVGGTIPLSNGVINGDTFMADYTGSLTDGGRSFSINATIDGGFLNNGGQNMVLGIVSGTSTDVLGDQSVGGAILAAQP